MKSYVCANDTFTDDGLVKVWTSGDVHCEVKKLTQDFIIENGLKKYELYGSRRKLRFPVKLLRALDNSESKEGVLQIFIRLDFG